MKKILGIDLGVASIGWALILESYNKTEIIKMGVRIIHLDTDEKDEFSKGNKISKNQKRTQRRTLRKGYYRYTLRRIALTKELKKFSMFDENLFKIPQLDLWNLRAKAVMEKLSLPEIGRVLYHLNQKRGYKHAKSVSNLDSKQTEYVSNINNRYEELKSQGLTIGQKFYNELIKNQHYRTKQQVFPREAYIEEFDKIINFQKKFYPDILTDNFIKHIRDEIIYFQRKLKSQKGLVNICEFEGFKTINKEGNEIFVGPKVAHKSNPLFQVAKLWESINNIKIEDKRRNLYPITIEQKSKIFDYLNNNEKISRKDLLKILEIEDEKRYNLESIKNGLQGNKTIVEIMNAVNNEILLKKLLKFDMKMIEEKGKSIISPDFIKEPLYELWHTIYSIQDLDECKKALIKKFDIDEITAENLAKIDFVKHSYGNKSVKVLRKIIPFLMEGFMYNQAMEMAGYKHSFSETKEDISNKKLLDQLPLLQKNSLRQPVVEKILNQLIHLVNDIINEKNGLVTTEERENGNFEIRIELARELKQNAEERSHTDKKNRDLKSLHDKITKQLNELNIRATRNNILKYKLFMQNNNNKKFDEIAKSNAMCIYTGKTFSLTDALIGNGIDIEHIIPKSLLFDDSQENKTLTFRYINEDKGDRTAYDYMASKGKEKLDEYIERVHALYTQKIISKAKRDKLLTSKENIPQDFIQRQLRETQYIARKSKEILSLISRNVWSTSGNVTEFLRRIWGWDDILMDLQLERIKQLIPNPLDKKITEIVEWQTDNGEQTHSKEVIKDWSKRNDHRHHAIDALVVACTKQGFIQRMNTLSANETRNIFSQTVQESKKEFKEKLSLLEKYLICQKPFSTSQVKEKVSEILVSFKPGKKVATYGKRFAKINGKNKIVQKNVIVPRGALSEETIYGKIKVYDKQPVEYLLENPHLIVNPNIKKLIEDKLMYYNHNISKAKNSLKNNPIYLDKIKTKKLEEATCFKEEFVVKYALESLKKEDLEFIVDKPLKVIIENRLAKHNNNFKEAFKEPLYFDKEQKIKIRTVRLFTGLKAVETLKKDENNKPISFIKPSNNHHIAIYEDEKGNLKPFIATFWHCVERKKYGIPTIIQDTNELWDIIQKSSKSYNQTFLDKLPPIGLKLVDYFQVNEMFVCGLSYEDFENYFHQKNYKKISNNLYRLQKLSFFDIYFRHHLETKLKDGEIFRGIKKYYRITSLEILKQLNPIKVKIDRLGNLHKT